MTRLFRIDIPKQVIVIKVGEEGIFVSNGEGDWIPIAEWLNSFSPRFIDDVGEFT